MKFFRYTVYILVIIVIVLYVLTFYVDHQLAKKDYSASYDDCRKVWSARGLYGDGVEQNSITSIKAAIDAGAIGSEVDIFYDVEMQDFIVSHSRPYSKKQGKLLTLAELFEATSDDGHYFWLDFKKLRHLNEDQLQAAIERLRSISQKNNQQARLYVEGEAPVNISRFREAGFHTIYDTHSEPESMSILSTIMINLYKMIFYFGDHSVMGIEYGELDDPVYGPENRRRLKDVPLFLYHVPVDEYLLKELLKIENVRAFIVGSSVSINFHHMNNCD